MEYNSIKADFINAKDDYKVTYMQGYGITLAFAVNTKKKAKGITFKDLETARKVACEILGVVFLREKAEEARLRAEEGLRKGVKSKIGDIDKEKVKQAMGKAKEEARRVLEESLDIKGEAKK